MRILAVNAGSSSLKLSLLDRDDRLVAAREIAASDGRVDPALVASVGEADAVAHRIVHGGTRFHDAVVVDAAVRDQLGALTDLAPLHQPKSLAALDAARRALPELPHVACFDTAFHADMPAAAATYAVPREWRERHGLRRYGFHGLAHAYAARRSAALLERPLATLRLVTCHLGAGASVTAVDRGRSIDTTMGFTPLEGLVMATRSGSVDPGMLLWLVDHAGIEPPALSRALEHESGLVALAGSADMRVVIDGATHGDERARLALECYLHSLVGAAARMAAALGGLDALVFTGGVGENAPLVRERAAAALAFLGVSLAHAANDAVDGDAVVGDGSAPVVVVRAREDVEMARAARALLHADDQ